MVGQKKSALQNKKNPPLNPPEDKRRGAGGGSTNQKEVRLAEWADGQVGRRATKSGE